MSEVNYLTDLFQCEFESSKRGLLKSVRWACELYITLPPASANSSSITNVDSSIQFEYAYRMGKSCFDMSEFDRCAFFTKESVSREGRFLHFYARYMSAEKKRLDSMIDTGPQATTGPNDNITSLFCEIRSEMNNMLINGQLMDGYLLYVYGITLLKLDLIDEAIDALAMSVRFEPLCWVSWQQLSVVIDSKTQLEELDLPTHWFKKLFLGATYLELQLNEEALAIYTSLAETFKNCSYIKCQMANARNNLRNVDMAIDLFDSIREHDPYRIDSWDTYSHALFVKDLRPKLSSLAHAANNIDPFRVETCICIANFYSLRGQHQKAAVYFSRSLQLNPRHISSWTLMGHEYMELKNTGGAIMSYRSAIECNKKDYRAWYGLGQAYEILKMPAYSLYYYSVARSLRPYDVSIIMAMGETLERLQRTSEAIKCYWKAGGPALFKLGQLYVSKDEEDKAAAAYSDYITFVSNTGNSAPNADLASAYKFLAEYYFKRKDLKAAHNAAQQCQQYPETRDAGKRILKEISELIKSGSSKGAFITGYEH